MDEKKTKRREWVKTVAIIFLSVMLVLTFFSQTIMNYSLPEVAAQYVQSGSITAKIRGMGMIESGDPYNVMVKETRKVSSVAVRVGDKVQKGDVLLYLAEEDSDELEMAKNELKMAQEAYDKALLTDSVTASDINAADKNVSAETYRKKITDLQASIKNDEKAIEPLQKNVRDLEQAIADINQQILYEQDVNVIANERLSVAESALQKAEREKNAAYAALSEAVGARDGAQGQLDAAVASGADAATIEGLQAQLQTAEGKVTSAQQTCTATENTYSAATTEYNIAFTNAEARNTSAVIVNLRNQAATNEINLYNARKELTAAQEAKTQKESQLTELISQIDKVTSLENYLNAIEEAKKRVEELEKDALGGTVNADIAGTVTAIYASAGKEISAAMEVVVIQPEGQGYTLSFSVTNEQASRLSVGDRADLINSWRYDDVDVVLAKIQPDKNEPGKKKLLTFNVTGEVTAGQTLNVSVGQKSANYDLIVPNSAIREDNNGKFILTVESKSSPLGNRYIATRVDVEVLASDDTQSAISGGLYGYEFIITTSTKPVEAGKQVRLAE
ncbi:MAG: HlyD family efflux transporter periplasmic adaptor subunit [Lachnospiraceae bacterium]|nr:HlyD family efflux transporter periplasmic adaptor subunit [Lachnospiraceae bacterium]